MPVDSYNNSFSIDPIRLCEGRAVGWWDIKFAYGMFCDIFWLVVEPTHLKNIRQNGIISPGRGEHKNYSKPPPSICFCLMGCITSYSFMYKDVWRMSTIWYSYSRTIWVCRVCRCVPISSYKNWDIFGHGYVCVWYCVSVYQDLW